MPAPSSPSKENYDFAGWNPGISAASADTTYSATWKEKLAERYEDVSTSSVGSNFSREYVENTTSADLNGTFVSDTCTATIVYSLATGEEKSRSYACKVYGDYVAPQPEPQPEPDTTNNTEPGE